MNIVQASLKYKQVTLSILAIVFLAGVYSLFNMPRREDPKITIRQGLVLAFYPGANSVQVEEQVTRKLEQYLFQYKEVKKEKTHSTTRDGAVVIYVRSEEHTSELQSRQYLVCRLLHENKKHTTRSDRFV